MVLESQVVESSGPNIADGRKAQHLYCSVTSQSMMRDNNKSKEAKVVMPFLCEYSVVVCNVLI